MNIGIAKEIKPFEGRVALTPGACSELIALGHDVHVESDAGVLSGYINSEYEQVGVVICKTARALYQQCPLIVKVKEPLAVDLSYLTAKHTIFCFLHLAANPDLTARLLEIGVTAVGFEMVREYNTLPILKPMSEIAGKLSVQIGANLLHLQHGGSGILIGGLADSNTEKGNVLVLGAGSAGRRAALLAHAMGANVLAFDQSDAALSSLQAIEKGIRVSTDINECIDLLPNIDLMVGALLVTGKKTPRLVSRDHVNAMRAGSVIVDISVDQGGCIETTKATNYDVPTYVAEGVTHFCVTNMPGAVPRTATQALSHVLPTFIHRLAVKNSVDNDEVIKNAVNIKGKQKLF